MAAQQLDDEDKNQQDILDAAEQIAKDTGAVAGGAAGAAAEPVDEAQGAPDDTTDLSDSDSAATPAKADVPTWKDYLTKKYQLDKKVGDVRSATKDDLDSLGMIQGLTSMFGGGAKQSKDVFDQRRADAGKPLEQVTKDRDLGLKDFMTQREVGRQDVSDAVKAKLDAFTQGQNERTTKQETDQDNPDSDASKSLRATIKAVAPNLATGPEFEHASYTQLAKVYPGLIQTYETAQGRKEAAAAAAAARAAAKDNAKSDRLTTANTKFAKDFSSDENKYAAASGKIDDTLHELDQATTTGGVTSKLVPLSVARQIAGRLNPQEIAAAGGDPSFVGKIQRMISTAEDGKIDQLDGDQFRALLNAQKSNLAAVREKQRGQSVYAHAKATGQDPKDVRGMVYDESGVSAPAPAASAPELPPKEGFTVMIAPKSGKPGYVPNDQVENAKKGGFK